LGLMQMLRCLRRGAKKLRHSTSADRPTMSWRSCEVSSRTSTSSTLVLTKDAGADSGDCTTVFPSPKTKKKRSARVPTTWAWSRSCLRFRLAREPTKSSVVGVATRRSRLGSSAIAVRLTSAPTISRFRSVS